MDQFTRTTNLVLEAHQDTAYETFLKARQAGAVKIHKAAAAKGGPATLTAQHFKAKAVPYKIALEHASDEHRDKVYAEHAERCLKQLKSWKTMTQRDFQTIMGELEVWGEVYIKSIK